MKKTFPFALGSLLLALFLLSSCATKVTARLREADELKKQGIVFRLHDYKQRYAHLEKIGLSERAVLERAENERYNRELMGHFRQHFDFCEVRFFYASQISDLKARRPVLLNADLQTDASLPLPEQIIVAGFDYDNVENHTFQIKMFRLEGTNFKISPTFRTWIRGLPAQPEDVIRLNRILHKRGEGK